MGVGVGFYDQLINFQSLTVSYPWSTVRPLWVKLQKQEGPLKADSHYELQCQVVGSKPEPTITWWKGSQPMRNTKQMVIEFDHSLRSLVRTLANTLHLSLCLLPPPDQRRGQRDHVHPELHAVHGRHGQAFVLSRRTVADS